MEFIRLRLNILRVHSNRLNRLNAFKYVTSGYGNHEPNSPSRDLPSNNSQHKLKSLRNSYNKQHEEANNKNERNVEDSKLPKYRRALDHQVKDDLVEGSYWSEPVGSKKSKQDQ